MAKRNESKEGRGESERPRKGKMEFVSSKVNASFGTPAHEAVLIPREMFQPGPVGDYYFANQGSLEFEIEFDD